jgi:hypothetical protein
MGWREPFWGKLATILGLGSLIPLAGGFLAVPALGAGWVCLSLARNQPQRRSTALRGWLATGLALLGIALTIAEAWGFLAWKRAQAEYQRRTVTEMRLKVLEGVMDQYAARYGTYPVAATAQELRAALVPDVAPDCPIRDGWGRDFLVASGPQGYCIRPMPIPRRGISRGSSGRPEGNPPPN